ncbi:facilitated trehalose transporter Tret1-like [Portunus trituberculatus]|uniref:facilitated trehalose transporter Tret1-like n=1 Tax=Portunus trituberculatus TaxID=210409 RepID=UPI001E1CDE44|nr:facilitated trehalose transporter Tret1-like [Portunus trituberculatus]XP_045120064.1 facilitated trehalose transporter Tret1-like [Portunus trituberculatus]
MGFKTWLIYRWKQICAACVLGCAVIMTGNVVGWSVEVSRIMEDPNTSFNFTQDDHQWLVSCGGIAAIFSTAGAGMLVELVGPCRLLGFMLVPAAIGWILMATTLSLPWIYVGRVITGAIGFMITTVAQPVIAEMCLPDVRGLLSSLTEIMVSVGMLLVYILARFLSWQTTTLICGVLLFPLVTAILFVPESPYWLLRRGREKMALRSLMRLRAPEHDVDSELNNIRDAINQQTQHSSIKQQFRSLKETANYRPVVLVTSMFLLRELGGAMNIFMYAVFFFENAGVMLDPFSCSIVLGFSRLIFTVISATIIDKVGRRPLLLSSTLICSLTLYITGGVLSMEDQGIGWLPLACVVLYVASFGMGVGPVPWILLGELLPTPVRSIGASIVTSVFVIVLFIVTNVFPDVATAIGVENACLIFATFQLILALIVFLFVPETRGRTLEELQQAFVGNELLTPFSGTGREGYTPAYGSTFPSGISIASSQEKVR